MNRDIRPLVPVYMTPEEELEILTSLLQPRPIQPSAERSLTLDNLVIEEKSPRDSGNNKTLQTYDKSMESLRSRGFKRHLRPDEAFRILIDAIENKGKPLINPSGKGKPLIKSISEDMLSSYGEWLSLAMLRNGAELSCYLDPENLVWNGTSYVVNGALKHSGEHKFNIKRIHSEKYVDLDKFPQDLVTFLYSRPYDKLPEVMRKENRRSQLWLPGEGIIRPCGRGSSFDDFDVSGYDSRASRGVRERR